MHYTSQLPTWHIDGMRILLRTDLNIPLDNGSILNDAKLQAIRPTLDYIVNHGGIGIILTHIGRPDGYDASLSTRLLLPWFKSYYKDVVYAPTIESIFAILKTIPKGSLILCENMRFFEGERSQSLQFAQALKIYGDAYVNDGFASMHRTEASITLLPTLFATDKKTIGLYTEKELNDLDRIIKYAEKPIVLVIGGKKLKSKLPYIRDFLNIAHTIIICPSLAFTFLKAQGISTGLSLVEENLIDECRALLTEAKNKNINIVLPSDIVISYDYNNEPYEIVPTTAIPSNAYGISIGPKTNLVLKDLFKNAHTIIYNGAIGFLEKPASLEGLHCLMQSIINSKATSLIAGGDSVAALHSFNMQDKCTHLSLGGGATLFYFIHKTLPALNALSK